jgi:SP family sugar:H+ symporter-like MFS transporter
MARSAGSVGFVVVIAAAAALGGFLFGFDTACINGAVVALRNHFQVGPVLIGLSVSLALLGSAAGAFLAGPFADRHGRIRAMLLASLLFTVSAIGSGFPFTIWDFIVWRIIGGLGVGMASAVAPAYIAEVAPAHLRGRLGSLQQLAIVIGIFVALMANYFIVRSAGSASAPWLFGAAAWKWMFWAETPAAIAYGLAALVIPESPRYLAAAGRTADALRVLTRLLGDGAEAKLREIVETSRRDHKPRLSDVRGPVFGLLPIVWVGMVLSIFQQFVGINVIFYYSSSLWQSVGFGEQHALYVTMLTGLTNIVTTLVAMALVDRLGRKPLLLVGSAGMAVTLAAMAWCFTQATVDASGAPSLSTAIGRIALVAANLYVFFFGCSWGPVVWVLLGEMFNNRIRGAALALGAGVQWIANFIVSTTFPPMSQHLGLGVSYGTYAAFAALSFAFVFFKVQETKGRELESM